MAGKIDEDLLGRFERLFKSKGDAAVVAIEHGVCTGCHMKVTTATAAQVKAGKEIVSCENCGRILYDSANERLNSYQALRVRISRNRDRRRSARED